MDLEFFGQMSCGTNRSRGQTFRGSISASSSLILTSSRSKTSLFAEQRAVTHLEEATRAWQRDKTIVSPHGEVHMSDHSPNHHHSDLVYGNHLSTEQTPPAHHRGIFQGLFKAKSNISRGAGGGGGMSSPSLFV